MGLTGSTFRLGRGRPGWSCTAAPGYLPWDMAMRKGNVMLVVACSYLTPLFSTTVSSIYLRVVPTIHLWLGCALIIAGSVLSWRSIRPGEGP